MVPAIKSVFINDRSYSRAGTFVGAAYHTSYTFHHNIRWSSERVGRHGDTEFHVGTNLKFFVQIEENTAGRNISRFRVMPSSAGAHLKR